MNTLRLPRPTFIFEHPDGTREVEYRSESMATEKKASSARLQLWQDFTTEEADLVEERIPHEAQNQVAPSTCSRH